MHTQITLSLLFAENDAVYTIIAVVLFLLPPFFVVFLMVIIIIMCCKKRKQEKKSVKRDSVGGENPSDSTGISHLPRQPENHEMRRVSSECVDMGHSPPGPVQRTDMERNEVGGVGGESDQVIYEEVMGNGECDPIDHEAPQSQSQDLDAMEFNMNVAYEIEPEAPQSRSQDLDAMAFNMNVAYDVV